MSEMVLPEIARMGLCSEGRAASGSGRGTDSPAPLARHRPGWPRGHTRRRDTRAAAEGTQKGRERTGWPPWEPVWPSARWARRCPGRPASSLGSPPPLPSSPGSSRRHPSSVTVTAPDSTSWPSRLLGRLQWMETTRPSCSESSGCRGQGGTQYPLFKEATYCERSAC